jgi:hypothetical protein
MWLLALVTIAIVVSSVTSVDHYAREDLDSLFRRALVTFTLARTINGLEKRAGALFSTVA